MVRIILLILQMLWFFLPAYGANMGAGGSKFVFKSFNTPLDFGKSFKGVRIFGDHKTIRGYLVGIFVSIILVYIQKFLFDFDFFEEISLIDYGGVNLILLGFLFGFGALFGDSVKSFFKRRIGKRSGGKWIPFDQLDWVIGSIIFVSFIFTLGLVHIIISLILFFFLHLGINIIFYKFGLRDEQW